MHYFAPVSLADLAAFALANFFCSKGPFAEFSLVSDFFQSKKGKIKSYFYCFRTKKVASFEKIPKWKTSFKIKYVNKSFVNFIQISTAFRI